MFVGICFYFFLKFFAFFFFLSFFACFIVDSTFPLLESRLLSFSLF